MLKRMLISALLLCGCGGRDAIIISLDGTVELGHCSSALFESMPTCIGYLCPDGFFTLKEAEKVGGDAVIRCLPPHEEHAK